MSVYENTVRPQNPFKNRDEHVVSLNKRVKESCERNKETAAKLANILYHFYLKNLKEGGDGTFWTSNPTLGRLIGRSLCTVGRGLRENERQDLFIIERFRCKKHQIRLRVTPTEELLRIKGCSKEEGDISNLSQQNAEINNLCEPQFSEPDRPISAPVLIREYIVQLNRAHARKTNQENLSKNKYNLDNSITVPIPLPPEPETGLLARETTETTSNPFAEESLKAVKEILLPVLEHSVFLVEKAFKKAIGKLQKSHFGNDPVVALGRFRDYLTKVANNPFLTGKKAMKSLDLFLISIGFLLTPKTIEDSWHNAGFFDVWEEKPSVPHPGILDQGIQDKRVSYQGIRKVQGAEPDCGPTSPTLGLEEALTTAGNPVDKGIKQKLYETLGAVTYQAWIHGTGFVAKGFAAGFTDGELDFEINSGFARDYVLTHYGHALRKAFASVVMN